VKDTKESLSDLLFPLQYRGKALALLLLQPERHLHVREIARLTGTIAGTMSKELSRLHRVGLLEQNLVGNQVHFSANQRHPIYPELSSLLRKTLGLADVVRVALSGLSDRIEVAFVFGSVARATDSAASDIDVMLIGSLDYGAAVSVFYEAQKTLQREINPKVYSPDEWREKIMSKSPFATEVQSKPKIFLMGTQDDLDKLVEPGTDRPA
jgi:predicted nucleotidyltransferase